MQICTRHLIQKDNARMPYCCAQALRRREAKKRRQSYDYIVGVHNCIIVLFCRHVGGKDCSGRTTCRACG